MPRYIDADALIEAIKSELWDWQTLDDITATSVLKQTISDIQNAPTADVVERKDLDTITETHEQIGYDKGFRDGYAQADVVEVVRCKECKYFCKVSKYCSEFMTTDEDGFCAWGERREDE